MAFPLSSHHLGELKTASALDRERTPVYKLIAQATDGGGLFCRSEISLTVLDVNDNPPSFAFTQYLASVFENASPKALVTRLQANDLDEGRYTLISVVTVQYVPCEFACPGRLVTFSLSTNCR